MPIFRFAKLVRDRIITHQIASGAKPTYRLLNEGHNHQVVQELDALFRSEETAYEKIYDEERKNVPETVKTFLRQMTENTSALLIANIYALFRQDIALRKVQNDGMKSKLYLLVLCATAACPR